MDEVKKPLPKAVRERKAIKDPAKRVQNLQAARKLVKAYKSFLKVIEKPEYDYGISSSQALWHVTGFATFKCFLCQQVNTDCYYCIHYYRNHGESFKPPCAVGPARKTYMAIYNADTLRKQRNAVKNRIKYLEELIEEVKLAKRKANGKNK